MYNKQFIKKKESTSLQVHLFEVKNVDKNKYTLFCCCCC